MYRDPTLVRLSREHFAALAASAHVEMAALDAALEPLCAEMVCLDLPRHFADEEAALLRWLPADHEERLRIDHAALLDLLEQVQARRGRIPLERLAGLLRAHVRWEERTLFPWLQSHLSPSAWREVACALQAAGEQAAGK